jgi:hypothetical protein
VLLGIALGVGIAGSPHARAQDPLPHIPSVTPILNCVVTDEAAGTMDVYWGYASSHSGDVTIPAGAPGNQFAPGLANRSQPATFKPGIHPLEFSATFAFSDSGRVVSWMLDGNFATAEAGLAKQACTEPFPLEGPAGPRGPAGAAGTAGPQGPGPGAAIRTVVAQGNRSSAAVSCAANEALIGGGGSCTTFVQASAPSGNGWAVTCKGTDIAVATAMCARK